MSRRKAVPAKTVGATAMSASAKSIAVMVAARQGDANEAGRHDWPVVVELKKRIARHPWKSNAAFLVAICALVYLPIFFGKILFFRDLARWIYPARDFIKRTLVSGQWPLWNPEVGLGFSVSSDPLYGLFYPGNWLYFLGPTAFMTTLVGFIHLLWGALGMLVLARRFGLAPYPALVGALAWALSGTTTSWWTAGVLLNAAAWIPWCASGWVALFTAKTVGRREVIAAALPLMMSLLLGEVFVSMMGVGLGMALGVHARRTIPMPANATSLRKRLLVIVGALLFGLMGGAATVVPAMTDAGATPRGTRLSKDLAEVGSFHPWRLVELMAPGILGDPFDDYPGELVVGEPRLSNRPLTDSAYAGAAALGLALMAFGRKRRLATGIAVIAVVALLVALGKYTLVHGLLRTLVAPLAYLRYPEKYLIIFVPAVALLVGLGAQRLFENPALRGRRALVPALMLLGLSAGSGWLMPVQVVPYFRAGLLWGAFAFAAIPLITFTCRERPDLCRVLVLGLIVLDLAIAVWPLQRFAPVSILQTAPPLAKLIRDDYARSHVAGTPRLFRSKQLEQVLSDKLTFRDAAMVEAHTTQTLAANTSNVFGIAGIGGYDAAVPATFVDLIEHGRQEVVRRQRLLSCDYVLAPMLPRWDEVARKEGLATLAAPLALARLYRLPAVLPRVYFAANSEIANDLAARARILSEPILSGQMVLLAPDKRARVRQAIGATPAACQLVVATANRVEADCAAPADGYVVFVEQFHRGWTATVDNGPAPVLRANLVMRAVPLTAGRHKVVLQFTAPAVNIGLAISLSALVALFGYPFFARETLLRLWRRRKAATTTTPTNNEPNATPLG